MKIVQKRKTSHFLMDKKWKIVCLFMVLGLILRIGQCFWGYPYALHPDEGVIIKAAMEMIYGKTWEVNIFYRPDHFEVKCCAILFQIISYLRYGVSADVAFVDHSMVFYLIARGYTVIWGVAMIPLMYKMSEKLKQNSGLIAAFITTFLPIFVEHSAYATPDIVLATFVLCIAYLSLLYLEKRTWGKLIGMSLLTGIGITIKYTCAISCLWIAFVVIYDAVRKKEYKIIFQYGIIAFFTVFLATFFMAPNLFTNIEMPIAAFIDEATPTHLGADGWGFWGNFVYYLTCFGECIGIGIFFGLIGVGYLIKRQKRINFSIGLGLLFWICTSVLSLHWERWGMPIYVFFVIVFAIGMKTTYDWAIDKIRTKEKKVFLKFVYGVIPFLCALICFNLIITTVGQVKLFGLTAPRVEALHYCEDNGITEEYTLSDGYSPYYLPYPKTIDIVLDEEGNIELTENQKNAKYIIITERMYGRYYAEPERYESTVAMYDAIQEQCELIKEFDGSIIKRNSCMILNIMENLKFIATGETTERGDYVRIYKINTK